MSIQKIGAFFNGRLYNATSLYSLQRTKSPMLWTRHGPKIEFNYGKY